MAGQHSRNGNNVEGTVCSSQCRVSTFIMYQPLNLSALSDEKGVGNRSDHSMLQKQHLGTP